MDQLPTSLRRTEHATRAEQDETQLRLAMALALLAMRHEWYCRTTPELTASVVYLAGKGGCEPRYVLV